MQAINEQQYQNAIIELVDFISTKAAQCKARGWDYVSVGEGESPENYEALKFSVKEDAQGRKVFPVLADSSETSVYVLPAVNVMFRFWHDVTHLEHNLSFSYDAEMEVARLHIEEGKAHGLSELALAILQADTLGQVKYYYMRKEFVKNQEAFVMSCLQHGINKACRLPH